MEGAVAAPGAALANRSYSVYLASSFVSNIGTFMQSLGVPFILYELTERNAWVGASVAATMGPSLIVIPIAGVLADRVSRKLILLVSISIQAAAAAALWLLSAGGALTPWRIIGLLIVGGFGSGFQNSTAHALIPQLVAPAHIAVAIRFNTVNFNVARIIGPALAGVVLATWGVTGTFALNTLSFAVGFAGLAYARPRRAERIGVGTSMWQSYLDGLRHVGRYPSLQLLIWFSVVVSAFAMSVSLLAAGLVAEGYGRDGGLAQLIAVFGGGATICAAVLVARGDQFRRSRSTVIGVLLYGAAIVLAAATPHYAVGLVAFAFMGVGHSIVATACNTSMQAQLVDEYRGRVLSVFVLASFMATPIAALVGGKLGDLSSIRLVIGIYGALMLAWGVAGVTRWRGFALFDSNTAV